MMVKIKWQKQMLSRPVT